MTDPERGEEGASENMSNKSGISDKDTMPVDLNEDHSPDDSKVGLINGGAGTDHSGVDVQIQDPSSDGEVSFSGLGKDEVMQYADAPFWKRLRMILFILFWIGWFAMLITAVVIIALAPRCPPRPDLKWYQTDSVYQVVPESFKDSGSDGYGDFEGLKSKLSYIDGLGSKSVWLSNIYEVDARDPTAIIDHGKLSNEFSSDKADTPKASAGTDFKAWIKKLVKEGKRIILDLVPNQTSKKHEWFEKSKNKEGKYAKYYVWRQGNGNAPPNDWVMKSDPQKSAWTKEGDRWYLHRNSEDTADLNLEDSNVQEEIKDIMKAWLTAGVGGFHVNDVDLLVENSNFSSIQPYNYEGTLDFLSEIRSVVEAYNKPGRERFLFATVDPSIGKENIKMFYGEGAKKGVHMVIPMNDLNKDSNAGDVDNFMKMIDLDADNWVGLGLGNQFTERVASRMEKNPNKLNAAHALQLLMRGTSFTYYGDEYGQYQGDDNMVPSSEWSYSPMQWNNQKNAGFSSGTPWQKVGSAYVTNNVQAATAHFTSSSTPLRVFKDLVDLRAEPSFQWGEAKVCAPNNELLLFSRKAFRFPFYVTMMNMGGAGSTQTVSLSAQNCVDHMAEGTVVFHSRDKSQVGNTLNFHDHPASLQPGDIVVVEFATNDVE